MHDIAAQTARNLDDLAKTGCCVVPNFLSLLSKLVDPTDPAEYIKLDQSGYVS